VSQDPRVLRTRRRLKSALLELIDEVGYEAVTIELLTVRADVARSTFYAHYSAKEDLLFAGFDEWLLSFAELPPPVSCEPWCFRFSLPLLRHGATQQKFFRGTILRGPSHRVRRRLKEILAEVALREMQLGAVVRPGENAAKARGRARAVAGAFLGLLEWWLDEGSGVPPEDVDRIFQETVGGPRP
jgi:AcrR family transcriptional regulator